MSTNIEKQDQSLYSTKLTYHELIEFHTTQVQARGVSQRQIANHLSALHRWMEQFGLSEQTIVGSEMDRDFLMFLNQHLSYLTEKGRTKSTLNTKRSLLGKWHFSWRSLLSLNSLPKTFTQAINHLFQQSGLSLKGFARAIGAPHSSLHGWLKDGRRPSPKYLFCVSKIEELSNLPEGALRVLLPQRLLSADRLYKSKLTVYGKRHSVNCRLHYLLPSFPPQLEAEWNKLVEFMTCAILPEGFARNSSWRVNPDGIPTANYYRGFTAAFFGFLCLDPTNPELKLRGKGFSLDKLSLVMLGDKNLVTDYIEFKKIRAEGTYTSETINFLAYVACLLRPGTGYLAQHPEFGQRLLDPVPEGEWDKWCLNNRSRITFLRKTFLDGRKIKQGRDVNEPLQGILSLAHPIYALKQLIESIRANYPPLTVNPVTRATYKRNLLLIQMLTANPLRVRQFCLMTWRRDNSGNLYKQDDGSWWLRFKSPDFKNERGAAKGDYNVPVVSYLWKEIEEYLYAYRPHLVGNSECDFVFVMSLRHRPRRITPTIPMFRPNSLTNIVRTLTQLHIPNCPGFGPHSFRHIIATDYIKNNFEGYEMAARILHDSPETIRKAYVHIKAADYFDGWNRYLSTIIDDEEEE